MDEVILFGLRAATDAGNIFVNNEAIDCSVQMKILPKLRGEDTPAMRECFEKLIAILNDLQLSGSAAKCVAMYENLLATGATQYWR